MQCASIPVDESTRVAEARRVAVTFAQQEGVGDRAAEETAIVTSELASNLLKHAGSGELHISRLSSLGTPGVQVLAIDRGPGMANLYACVADGFSTTGTSGTGLGAVSRLADVFDGYSQPGRGTVLVARKFAPDRRNGHEGWVFAGVVVAFPGEPACGDNWVSRNDGEQTWVLVADGLGHGILAADASTAAVRAFEKAPLDSTIAVLEKVHLALRPTRGAAVAVSCIHRESGRVLYAGLGNIAGALLDGGRVRLMVSHSGTAGLEARRLQEFQYDLASEGAVVMHSDGISGNWSLDAYPGLLRRHPAVIAGVIYRDATRRRDDACVVVGRCIRE